MNPETDRQAPTTAAPGNADCSDARQIERALQLAIVQIDMSLRESGQSVEQMIGAITALSGSVSRISTGLRETAPETPALADCTEAGEHIQQAIMAFQFYDRMSQRFAHIMANLSEIITVISAPDGEHAVLWQNLQDRMRRVYSLEQEQIMYKALIEGVSIDESGDTPGSRKTEHQTGEIELF